MMEKASGAPEGSENPPRPRVGFVSLGCPKNLVDSEVMMGLLDRAGAVMTPDAETADILVVNTCSFIDKAKQESVDAILEMARLKTGGSARKLIVAGCLVERYRDEIQKNIARPSSSFHISCYFQSLFVHFVERVERVERVEVVGERVEEVHLGSNWP